MIEIQVINKLSKTSCGGAECDFLWSKCGWRLEYLEKNHQSKLMTANNLICWCKKATVVGSRALTGEPAKPYPTYRYIWRPQPTFLYLLLQPKQQVLHLQGHMGSQGQGHRVTNVDTVWKESTPPPKHTHTPYPWLSHSTRSQGSKMVSSESAWPKKQPHQICTLPCIYQIFRLV